jgi:nucleotide sugar dehydrogenase
MRVGIVGVGRVGQAVERLFVRYGHEVVAWDRVSGKPYPLAELRSCQFGVVCVGTPPGDYRAADVSDVLEAVERLPLARVLVKSTVPPGTTERMAAATGKELCYWPEYVGESKYHNPYFASDIDELPFVILGGEPAVRRWFVDRLQEVLGPTKHYFQCTAREAELIKYAENAYFATKIVFVNELRRLAEAWDADWHSVREGWLLDPRIERMHTAAFEDSPGFDGKCLPKDLDALIAAGREAGYTPTMLRAVAESNRRLRGAGEPLQDASEVGDGDPAPLPHSD